MAMWGVSRAERRLIQAIVQREQGPESTAAAVDAFGQRIAIPNWLNVVVLLRCVSGMVVSISPRCMAGAGTGYGNAPDSPSAWRCTCCQCWRRLVLGKTALCGTNTAPGSRLTCWGCGGITGRDCVTGRPIRAYFAS